MYPPSAISRHISGGNGEVGMSKPGDKAYTTRQNIHQACPKSLRPCTESHTLACTRMHKLEKRALTDAHSEAPIARLRSTQRSPPRTSRTPPSVGRAVDVDSRRDGAQSRRTSRKRPANAHRSHTLSSHRPRQSGFGAHSARQCTINDRVDGSGRGADEADGDGRTCEHIASRHG